MNSPDLSLITVVLNDINGLKLTIESIQSQKNIAIEHIIVDGGSTDGSQKLASIYSDVHVDSRSDGGIYQGMQRGAELATGKYLMFVNSSDLLVGTSDLSSAVSDMAKYQALWGFGPILESTLRSTSKLSGGIGELSIKAIASRKTFVPFPVVIMDRQKFFEIGGFKFSYKIAGDFDLIVRLAKSSIPIRWEYPLVKFSAGGISYTRPITAWREEHLIRVSNFDLRGLKSIFSWALFIKRILRWLIGKQLDIVQSMGIFGKRHWRDRF